MIKIIKSGIILKKDMITLSISFNIIQMQSYQLISLIEMIRRNKNHLIKENERKSWLRNAKVHQLQSQLEEFSYVLNEGTCQCQVNQFIPVRQSFITLQVYIKPFVGLFAGIEFRPEIYFTLSYNSQNLQPPKVYNNRRIFHPNISINTCQIVVAEFAKEWSPLICLRKILQRIKEVIIEPNIHCIPNVELNKQAAFLYITNRMNYREQVLRRSPLFLDGLVENNNNEEMSIEDNDKNLYFDIEEFFYPQIKSQSGLLQGSFKEANDQEQIGILIKQIKTISLEDRRLTPTRSEMEQENEAQKNEVKILNF